MVPAYCNAFSPGLALVVEAGAFVRSGTATIFGPIAQCLTLQAPETAFERGNRRFCTLLTIYLTSPKTSQAASAEKTIP